MRSKLLPGRNLVFKLVSESRRTHRFSAFGDLDYIHSIRTSGYSKFIAFLFSNEMASLKCVVQDCSASSEALNGLTVEIFPFPDEPSLKSQWMAAVGCHVVAETSGVCERHFEEKYLLKNGGEEKLSGSGDAGSSGGFSKFLENVVFCVFPRKEEPSHKTKTNLADEAVPSMYIPTHLGKTASEELYDSKAYCEDIARKWGRYFTGITPALIAEILNKPEMRVLSPANRTQFGEICVIAASSGRKVVEAKIGGLGVLGLGVFWTRIAAEWTIDGKVNMTALSLLGHMIARAAPVPAAYTEVRKLRAKIGGKDIWTMQGQLLLRQGTNKACQIWVERTRKTSVAEVDQNLGAVQSYFPYIGVLNWEILE